MSDNPRLDDLKRRVQQDPASIAFGALAEEYRRLGLFHDAIETCRAGLLRHPAYLSARVTLGRALVEVGEYDEAQTHLEQVVGVAPDNLAAIRALADIHHRRGDSPDGYAADQLPSPAAPPSPAPAVPVSPLVSAACAADKPVALAPVPHVAPEEVRGFDPPEVLPSPPALEVVSAEMPVSAPVDPVCERLEQFLAAIDRARASDGVAGEHGSR